MKTKHLDNEIERLNLMERTKDLSEYGQDMLNEFRAIKQALTIPVVVNCLSCGKNHAELCGSCVSDIAQATGEQAQQSR